MGRRGGTFEITRNRPVDYPVYATIHDIMVYCPPDSTPSYDHACPIREKQHRSQLWTEPHRRGGGRGSLVERMKDAHAQFFLRFLVHFLARRIRVMTHFPYSSADFHDQHVKRHCAFRGVSLLPKHIYLSKLFYIHAPECQISRYI